MRISIASQRPGTTNLSRYAAITVAVGLLLGAVSLVLGPTAALLGMGVLAGAIIVMKRPEAGVLGILVVTSSIIFEWKLPIFNVGFGSLHIPDLVFLALMGQIVLRAVMEQDFKLVRTPLDLPLMAFVGVAIVATAIGIFKGIAPLDEARRSLRIISYYMLVFPIVNLLRDDDHLRMLVRGFLALAMVVACAMVYQQMVGGSQLVVSGVVTALRTQNVIYGQVARINPPGSSVILTAFITYSVMLLLVDSGLSSMVRFLLWGLYGLALVITFNRSYWVVAGLGLGLVAILSKREEKQRILLWIVAVAYLLGVVMLLNKARPEQPVATFTEAALDRLGTLGTTDTLEEDSLQWRFVENQYARQQIVRNPWLGLGLGAKYRPFDPRIDYTGQHVDFRGYIHNAHLWILLKTGGLGYLALAWLSFTVLRRGFGNWRSIPDPFMRATVLGFTLTYMGVLLASMSSPMLMEWSWTPVLGLIMGTNEALIRLNQQAGAANRPDEESGDGQDA